jgi:hypothetical protein
MVQRPPSMLRTMPFLISAVDAMRFPLQAKEEGKRPKG